MCRSLWRWAETTGQLSAGRDVPERRYFPFPAMWFFPGNYEVPLGISFAELLALAGGVKGGRKVKAVIPGGSSSPVLRGETMLRLNMDYDSIAKAGSMLGTGGVIVLDETRCMVKSLLNLSRFYRNESCGQCTPCREGTGWLVKLIERIERGDGKQDDLDLLDSVASNIQEGRFAPWADAAGDAWSDRF